MLWSVVPKGSLNEKSGMAVIKSFFKSKQGVVAEKVPFDKNVGKITVEELKRLIPIRQLDTTFLESFALEHKAKLFAPGETLFTVGTPTESIFFLLEGEVELIDQSGKSYIIGLDSPKARFALSAGQVHMTTAVAKTDVSVLEASRKVMQMHQGALPRRLEIPAKYGKNRLLQIFAQHFVEDEMDIPAMPDTAAQLRKAMQKDIGVRDAVAIIQLDPVISGKLIQVANCPLYVTVNPAKSCLEAVNRIGLLGTRSLVTSLCLQQVFTSKKPVLKKYMGAIWRHSIYISSICYVLAKETHKVNPEEALLAGLIVEIGVIPLLSFADNLPDTLYTEVELKEAMEVVRGIAGRRVLEKWDFPEQMLDIPYHSTDWYQYKNDELSLLDIVVLAELHSRIGQKTAKSYPPVPSIPAASKLNDASLSPEHTLAVLHNAREKINETLRAFSQ